MEQIEGDSIEDVTDEMLDKLVSGHLAGNGYCKFNLVIFNTLTQISFYTVFDGL